MGNSMLSPQNREIGTRNPGNGVFVNDDQSPEKMAGLVSRNVTIAGHRTSVRLEPDMWTGLYEICHRERLSLHEICTVIAQHRRNGSSLTAAIRVFIMAYFRAAATDDGHRKAGHGAGHVGLSIPATANSHDQAAARTS